MMDGWTPSPTPIDAIYAPRYREPCPECDYEGCDLCGGTGFRRPEDPPNEPADDD